MDSNSLPIKVGSHNLLHTKNVGIKGQRSANITNYNCDMIYWSPKAGQTLLQVSVFHGVHEAIDFWHFEMWHLYVIAKSTYPMYSKIMIHYFINGICKNGYTNFETFFSSHFVPRAWEKCLPAPPILPRIQISEFPLARNIEITLDKALFIKP